MTGEEDPERAATGAGQGRCPDGGRDAREWTARSSVARSVPTCPACRSPFSARSARGTYSRATCSRSSRSPTSTRRRSRPGCPRRSLSRPQRVSGGERLTSAAGGDVAASDATSRPRGPRPSSPRIRDPPGQATRPSDRRADPDGALAIDQRPKPGRRLSGAARAVSFVGRGPGRAGRRDRGDDPPRRHFEGQVGADQVDPAGVSDTSPDWDLSLDWLAVSRGGGAEVPDVVARRGAKDGGVRAAVRVRDDDVPVDTHVSRVGLAPATVSPRRRVRGAPRHDARDNPARRGAGVSPEPAPPRPAHLPRRRPDCRGCALQRMCPSAFTFG